MQLIKKTVQFLILTTLILTCSACKQVRVKSEGTEQLREEIAYLSKKINSLESRIQELEKKNN